MKACTLLFVLSPVHCTQYQRAQMNLLWIQLKAAAHVAIEDSLMALSQALGQQKRGSPLSHPLSCATHEGTTTFVSTLVEQVPMCNLPDTNQVLSLSAPWGWPYGFRGSSAHASTTATSWEMKSSGFPCPRLPLQSRWRHHASGAQPVSSCHCGAQSLHFFFRRTPCCFCRGVHLAST